MAKKKAKTAKRGSKAKAKPAKRSRKKAAPEPEPENPELNLPEVREIPPRPDVPGGRMVHVKLSKDNSPEVVVHEHLKYLESIGKRGTSRSDKDQAARIAKARKVSKPIADTTAGASKEEKRKVENPRFMGSHDRTEVDK